jgi:CheY-like chemotaxis protein
MTIERGGDDARERARVLVVDDEALFAHAVARVLRDEADVVVALGGREAIEHLGSGAAFDLVLSDVSMPDVDGLELYEVVRRDHPGLLHRFVFISGGILASETRTRLSALPNDVLVKPFHATALRELVRSYLR